MSMQQHIDKLGPYFRSIPFKYTSFCSTGHVNGHSDPGTVPRMPLLVEADARGTGHALRRLKGP